MTTINDMPEARLAKAADEALRDLETVATIEEFLKIINKAAKQIRIELHADESFSALLKAPDA